MFHFMQHQCTVLVLPLLPVNQTNKLAVLLKYILRFITWLYIMHIFLCIEHSCDDVLVMEHAHITSFVLAVKCAVHGCELQDSDQRHDNN